jgi:hypothetical protein
MADIYRNKEGQNALRVLFCIGVTPAFFDADAADLDEIGTTIKQAFDNLDERFGLEVLGTMDDDELMVGPSLEWPWTCYVLANAPSVEAVVGVCNIIRETPLGPGRLWKYLRIEARVGRPLFFATK